MNLVTLLLDTSTAESDFLVLHWQDDAFQQSITGLSLKGILQGKQFKHLRNLKHVEGF